MAKKKHHAEEHVNHERWLVIYADMITLLMALFIIMWAISSVNISKFDELRASLRAAFSAKVLPSGTSVLTGQRAALDEKGSILHPITESTTGLNASAWFAREARLPSSVGRAQIKAARALRNLEDTDRAWLDGRITREHVQVLSAAANPRIREHMASIQDELIGATANTTFHRWRLEVTNAVNRLDQDGPEPDDPAHTTATWARSGLFAELKAKFAGAEVELLEQIIEAQVEARDLSDCLEHREPAADVDPVKRLLLGLHPFVAREAGLPFGLSLHLQAGPDAEQEAGHYHRDL